MDWEKVELWDCRFGWNKEDVRSFQEEDRRSSCDCLVGEAQIPSEGWLPRLKDFQRSNRDGVVGEAGGGNCCSEMAFPKSNDCSRFMGLKTFFKDFCRFKNGGLPFAAAGPPSASVPRSSHLNSTWPVGQHFEVDVTFRMNAPPLASSRHDCRMTTRSKFPILQKSFVSTRRISAVKVSKDRKERT